MYPSPFTRRHLFPFILPVITLSIVAGGWFYFHSRTAHKLASLLPECDAVFYVDLRPIHTFSDFGNKPVDRAPDYQQFVDETGFQFERDLQQVALAVHPPEAVAGSATQRERRYSEVLVGHFDSAKMLSYLHKIANSVESYRATDIFLIPYEDRVVRVAVLDAHTVTISNTADPANIKGIIDRFRQFGPVTHQPTLLRDHFHDVPAGSIGWGIFRFNTPDGQAATLPLPNGIGFGLPKDTVTVVSLRYAGNIHFTTEAITQSEADAKKLTDSASTFLQLFRSIQANTAPSGSDQDLADFFDSVKVEQDGTRAVLSATVPVEILKKIVSDAPSNSSAPQSPSLPSQRYPRREHKNKTLHAK